MRQKFIQIPIDTHIDNLGTFMREWLPNKQTKKKNRNSCEHELCIVTCMSNKTLRNFSICIQRFLISNLQRRNQTGTLLFWIPPRVRKGQNKSGAKNRSATNPEKNIPWCKRSLKQSGELGSYFVWLGKNLSASTVEFVLFSRHEMFCPARFTCRC